MSDLINAFLRRLLKNDDSAAILAEEVLEDILLPVDRGLAAIKLWERVLNAAAATDMSFPKTFKVLWDAIIDGWLLSENEDEHTYERFIASVRFEKRGKADEQMSAKLRTGLDSLSRATAFWKVMRFLQALDFQYDHNIGDTVPIISKMLGRYTPAMDSAFAAYILPAIKIENDEWGMINWIYAFKAAAPFVAKVTESALQTAYDAAHVFDELGFSKSHGNLKLRLVSEKSAEIVWSRVDQNAGSVEEVANSKEFLEAQAKRIRDWYGEHPQVSRIPFTLVINARHVDPKFGVSMTSVPV